MKDPSLITLLVAVGGWVVVILQLLITHFEKRKQKADDFFLKTVDYFTGGSQKRSVGISLIEGFIRDKKDYSKIIVPLLANQFVYLLLSQNSDATAHEERNLVRIFFLLKELIAADPQAHSDSQFEVLDAIGRRISSSEKSSIDIPNSTLTIWQNQLGV